MSDSDEADCGLALAYELATELLAKKPKHPLLRYLLWLDDEVVYEDFVTMFGKPGLTRDQQRMAPAIAYMFAKYCVALREACENPDTTIVVHHNTSDDDDIPY